MKDPSRFEEVQDESDTDQEVEKINGHAEHPNKTDDDTMALSPREDDTQYLG